MSQSEKSEVKIRRGRGAPVNTKNRFVDYELLPLEETASHWNTADEDATEPIMPTTVYNDKSRSVVNENDSPDIGFTYSVNPYRGCEHGCVYCYARPTHEYFGLSAGLDFESKIFAKPEAPHLLRQKLMSSKWQPAPIAMSGVTDCYQPIERQLRITRGCLEVLQEFRNPVGIVTKNHLVTRDIDLLSDLASNHCAVVYVSLTTLDPHLCNIMEPRTSRPARRLEAIRQLSAAGIPVGVMAAPMIPSINDHELPHILEAAAAAGAKFAGMVPLRLPYAVKDLFVKWLELHFADRRDKVLNHIRSMRGGKLNDANFGSRMQGEGAYAEQLHNMFAVYCKRFAFNESSAPISTAGFRRPGTQLSLL